MSTQFNINELTNAEVVTHFTVWASPYFDAPRKYAITHQLEARQWLVNHKKDLFMSKGPVMDHQTETARHSYDLTRLDVIPQWITNQYPTFVDDDDNDNDNDNDDMDDVDNMNNVDNMVDVDVEHEPQYVQTRYFLRKRN